MALNNVAVLAQLFCFILTDQLSCFLLQDLLQSSKMFVL